MDCLFCKIIRGEIPSTKVYEDDAVYAFRDINPQTPVHVLIVPRKHMADALECDPETAGRVLEAAKKIAAQENVDKTSFRLLTNCGADARQTVRHLHFHLLGGAEMTEKMG